MRVLVVSVHVKPEQRERFLEVINHDAEHSVKDEPGCIRFDVLQDIEDPNHFLFHEVYKDEAARMAHRETPHFKMWNDAVPDVLAEPATRTMTDSLYSSDPAYAG